LHFYYLIELKSLQIQAAMLNHHYGNKTSSH